MDYYLSEGCLDGFIDRWMMRLQTEGKNDEPRPANRVRQLLPSPLFSFLWWTWNKTNCGWDALPSQEDDLIFFLHRAKLMTLRYKANVTWILLHIFASCLLADGGLHIITNRCSVGECSSCCREKDHVRPVCALHIIFKPKHIIACLESRACEEKRTLPTEPSTLTNGNNNISRSLIFWNDSVPMMNLVAKSLFFKVSYCICFIWRGFGSLGELFCRFLTFLLMCLDFLLFVFCLGTNKAALAPAGSSGEDVCPLWEECLCRKRGFQKENA